MFDYIIKIILIWVKTLAFSQWINQPNVSFP
jgi:hypothetical protein